MSLTAHCLIKNEDQFIGYAIRSVIGFVDNILVFDTGSTDRTVSIIKELQEQYPNKIMLEEKGACDKMRHTQLRQEMIERTTTDWFMILDGDEVWTERALGEATGMIRSSQYDGIVTRFYECVGDVYHTHRKDGYETVRFVKMGDVQWGGPYNRDTLYTKKKENFLDTKTIYHLRQRFWHTTHLERSSEVTSVYSSGTVREVKKRLTYFLIGKKIQESVPEVFVQSDHLRVSFFSSLKFFCLLCIEKICRLV